MTNPPPSATEMRARIEAGAMTLIDVREPTEVQPSGKASGALVIPLAAFPAPVDPRSPQHDPALPLDRSVALYCHSGARSDMAAQAMQQMGYAEAYNIGRLQDWLNAGGALER